MRMAAAGVATKGRRSVWREAAGRRQRLAAATRATMVATVVATAATAATAVAMAATAMVDRGRLRRRDAAHEAQAFGATWLA